jgi:hypothetical protein
MGLYYSLTPGTAGFCPATRGAHTPDNRFDYNLAYKGGLGQTSWFWCQNCQGLFFWAGGSNLGMCPANGNGGHDGSACTDTYHIPRDPQS